jgi:hypothetical protein
MNDQEFTSEVLSASNILLECLKINQVRPNTSIIALMDVLAAIYIHNGVPRDEVVKWAAACTELGISWASTYFQKNDCHK